MLVFAPPIQPSMPAKAASGGSVSVTGTAANLLTASEKCVGVRIQARAKDDSNSSITSTVLIYVQLVSTGALIAELAIGEEVFVPCSDTSELKLKTQSGTGHASFIVYKSA